MICLSLQDAHIRQREAVLHQWFEHMWWQTRRKPNVLLRLLSRIYAKVMLHDQKKRFQIQTCPPIPMISVGNITVGGSGKTPFVVWLASELKAQGFKPDVKLLAERLNVKESEVIEMGQRMDNWDVSLEAPVRSDSEDEQKSFLPQEGPGIEDIVAGQEMRKRLSEVLAGLDYSLNAKEKAILGNRLLSDEPQTLQTIADQFGISRERVRQIESNLLKKLKKHFEQELPDIQDFLTSERIVPAASSEKTE